MKSFKKFTSLFLALVMLVGMFSISALAAEAPTHTVSIYVQRLSRDEDGDIDPDSVVVYNLNAPIKVTVSDGGNLKQAVIAACNMSGSIITDPVWVTGDEQYLQSLTVNGTPLANKNSFEYDTPVPGYATYTGTSWMYFDAEPAHTPETTDEYPQVSLQNAIVTADMTITLSYESMTYVYPMSR